MSRIVILRHGNTFDKGDIVTRVGGKTDLPLSSSGQIQANKVKAFFQVNNSNYNFVEAYSSELIRTRQTAEAVLDGGHTAKSIHELGFLKEVNYGPDENKPEREVIERIGAEALRQWELNAIPPQGWEIDTSEIVNSWKSFINEKMQSEQDTLIVTSNGIARFVLQAFDAKKHFQSIKLKTCEFGIISKNKDQIVVEDWNVNVLS